MGAQYNPPGGSSSPGLPAWTFDPAQTGAPAAGHFQTNNNSPASVSAITLNNQTKAGSDISAAFGELPNSNIIVLTSILTGKSYTFYSTGPWSTGPIIASLIPQTSETMPFSGDFTVVSFGITNNSTSYIPGGSGALAAVLSGAGITPQADGTVTPVTSITTQGGIPTNVS